MKIADLMNQLQAESKKQASKSDCYGFAHGEFSGKRIKASSYIINTNSKDGVLQTSWFVDDKKISRAKLIAMFA